MRKLTAGILAHVDAGKTTLSEALLYRGGALRTLGRVDHADAFLDHDAIERERGITIFLKQAVLPLPDLQLTLLDTPGHVDFAAEAERTLQVLDCAILVVSAPDGPQGHTLTLWRLLERHNVPVFLFLNKMDQPVDRAALFEKLRLTLSPNLLDMDGYGSASFFETAALGDEAALSEYLDHGSLGEPTLRRLISERKCFPCFFGSALKLQGVDELLDGLTRLAPRPQWGGDFAARVYKITRDDRGARLTHVKITGGSLSVKENIPLPGGGEKVNEIRVYSGAKFTPQSSVYAGAICALTGLSSTFPGQALGAEKSGPPPALEPAISYRMLLPQGVQPSSVLPKLRELSEEDPQLHLEWNEALRQITVRLMGKIQAEILKRVISDRFGLKVQFTEGSIVYKETIKNPVEGVGHFEPLRHYAEIHLLIEPLPLGSGVELATACSEDDFAGNWQRLVLTHLAEKVYRGVLTGSALTDVRMTIVSGRAHLKHTEGGDFRQATYRAVRQGLMGAQSVLLEPWYDFRLELPGECLGRAMTDIQQMGGRFDPPEALGETALLTGSAPVSGLGEYWQTVASYTRGRGRLSCAPGGYQECHNGEEVIERLAYDPEADLDNSPDSVFCAHGAGFPVKWDQVPEYAHLETGLDLEEDEPESAPQAPSNPRPVVPYPSSQAEERSLQAIFERTYGQVRRKGPDPGEAFRSTPKPLPSMEKRTVPSRAPGAEFLLVDGYNIIFAWDELKKMAGTSLEGARHLLMDLLSNYQGYKKCVVILVFDAYKVKGNPGSVEHYRNIHVVYTKEAETADAYIERATYEIARSHPDRRVRVATSDNLEQLIILGHGAVRVSAREFLEEVEAAEGRISQIIQQNNLRGRDFRQLKHQLKQK